MATPGSTCAWGLRAGRIERIIKGLELPGGTSLRKLASEITVEQASAGSGAPAEYLLVAIDQ